MDLQNSTPHLTLVPPMEPIPFPGDFYITFQRELSASAQIAHLAETLAHVHWLYEGWTGLPHPLDGEVKRIYQQGATWAVRNCSEVERQVANNRAERWGAATFDSLQEQIKSIDTTPEKRDDLIRAFVRQCLSVERFALEHGSAELAPQEAVLVVEMMDGTRE